MQCPQCDAPLTQMSHEGHAIDACPQCLGVLVAFPVLRQIIETESVPRSDADRAWAASMAGTAGTVPRDDRPAIPCPACAAPMRRTVHAYDSGVWVDVCEGHGLWLEQGELAHLEAWAEARRRGIVTAPQSDVGREYRPRPGDDGMGKAEWLALGFMISPF